MRHCFLLLIAFVIPLSLAAQTTQSGYVKTKGRLDNNGNVIPGKRLGSVSIILSNGNSTVSSDNGDFTLTIPDKKFYLKSVEKQGYILADPEIVAKQYVYSSNPFVISMETPSDQRKDQIEAHKKLEATLRQQLQQLEKELEEQKNSNRLSEEEYYQKLQQLYNEKATEELIQEMSKRYAEIDYDLIDNFQRQLSQYILNGELQKADSLLKTKGNLSSEVSELHRIRESNIIEQEKLERRRLQLDSSMFYAEQLMKDIAMRCTYKAEILKLQFRWDSATFYLKLRSTLDSTNIEWLYETASYMYKYNAEYDTALKYFNNCKRHLEEHGNVNTWLNANVYNNIGLILYTQGEYTQALENLQKALQLWGQDQDYGEHDPNYALTCNNIGLIYQEFGQYDKAIQYHNKALQIQKTNSGEIDPEVASCYNNLGNAYEKIGNLSECKRCYEEALRIRKSYYKNEPHPDVAMSYINLGNYYRNVQIYSMAKEYYYMALDICNHIHGNNPLLFAECYGNLGLTCLNQSDFQNAEHYYLLTDSILKETFGENYPSLVICYIGLGLVYGNMGDIRKSFDYFKKAYKLSGETKNDAVKAQCCFYLGSMYDEFLDNDTTALQYYSEALELLNSMPNPNRVFIKVISDTIDEIKAR